ncbi:MAG: hypothetical protein F6K11_19770 [Leptolyngbya sp. SIO3F4]|nr:hypothetical protein [Leptolyngbya sp. SIO3F4]
MNNRLRLPLKKNHPTRQLFGLLGSVCLCYATPGYATPDNVASQDFSETKAEVAQSAEFLVSENPNSQENIVPAAIQWDSLTVETNYDFNNFDQTNLRFEPSLTGTLSNGDQINITTGFNQFQQEDVDTITNIPISISWQRQFDGGSSVQLRGGVDLYNRLNAQPSINLKGSLPLGKTVTLTMTVDHAPYKFNAQTIENRITAWRYGPDIYWQIDPHTSLFSLLRFGNYDDGNHEQVSFSRLEHKLLEQRLSLALNVFSWQYTQDLESSSGYFSPPDFLVIAGEVAWQQDITETVNCRLAGNLGEQRLNGSWALAYGYEGGCAIQASSNVALNLGYKYTNILDDSSSSSAFNNQKITGGLHIDF